MSSFTLTGQIIDLWGNTIFPGKVLVENGIIISIIEDDTIEEKEYILPGFIDSHVHVESSMLVPSEFARLAVTHGTVATVSDPHEIGNVLGIEGVRYMIRNGEQTPFKFFFGASPCVPATSFETAGATISSEDIRSLFKEDKLVYLSEMMNFPGVLNNDPEVMEKIALAKEFGKPVDGHAPGLRGAAAEAYAKAGITTDHECYTLEEAEEKIGYGMHILIREGSAAKNFPALHPLIASNPSKVMFCSDDKHPDNLVKGHINEIVKRSVDLGYDVMDVLRSACLNPIKHYQLPVGSLREGDPADFILINNLQDFLVLKTYINGQVVAEYGKACFPSVDVAIINHFDTEKKSPEEFAVLAKGKTLRVIEVADGELITKELQLDAKIIDGKAVSDPDNDILKITVVNRYQNSTPAIAFIRNFGLKKGAIASSVGHDSHNIIAVGVNDEDLCTAVNALIDCKGGVAVVKGDAVSVLPLPVAGIMSPEDAYVVAEKYSALDLKAKELGTTLEAPFMSLSFMALLVIPSLKLSDLGLFDGNSFSFTDLFIQEAKKHA
ncbi:MAG: adenine deaminase [Chlamydiales bacterium]|jgi:adenine deaminase